MSELILNKKTVCAIIVTYNRKFLLKRTLKHILEQTIKINTIIIIDNDSKDGSREFINNHFASKFSDAAIDFNWVRLSQNQGGAGGFRRGVQEFIKTNCNLAWLMDDDGFPDKKCLEILLEKSDCYSFIGPIVLSDKDADYLAFPLRLPFHLKSINKRSELDNTSDVIKDCVLPFNGTLISRSVVQRIGFPDSKFFIWGDEIDYLERARKSGASIFTCSKAFFYHPRPDKLGESMLFGLLRFNNPSSNLKLYCYCRNNFFNKKLYQGRLTAFCFVLKVFWFYLFTKPSVSNFRIALAAFYHACLNDFDRHSKYLGK